jgi:hypothetical protein
VDSVTEPVVVVDTRAFRPVGEGRCAGCPAVRRLFARDGEDVLRCAKCVARVVADLIAGARS